MNAKSIIEDKKKAPLLYSTRGLGGKGEESKYSLYAIFFLVN
jgi:hypothetical protein